jgi:putative membrane protein
MVHGTVQGQKQGAPVSRTRFPSSVYGHGSEPDPRFSLANERTFLAWIRTSLALVAAGVALEALAIPIAAPLRLAAALVFVLLGLLAAIRAWVGWASTERAMRLQQALPSIAIGGIIAAGVVIAVLVIAVGLFL